MTQTTGATTFRNVKVEFSSDGSTWIDISGSTSAVGVNGGERPVVEFKPLFSDTKKAMVGARERLTITVKSVYSENPTEAFALMDAAYRAKSQVYLRWSPRNVAGAKRFNAVNAYIKKPSYPGGEVSEPKPLAVEYEFTAESLYEDTTT
jgi:hypothetical protein